MKATILYKHNMMMPANSSGEVLPLMSAKRDELRHANSTVSSSSSKRNIAIFVILVLGSLFGVLGISQWSRSVDNMPKTMSLSLYSAMGSIIFGRTHTTLTAVDEEQPLPLLVSNSSEFDSPTAEPTLAPVALLEPPEPGKEILRLPTQEPTAEPSVMNDNFLFSGTTSLTISNQIFILILFSLSGNIVRSLR